MYKNIHCTLTIMAKIGSDLKVTQKRLVEFLNGTCAFVILTDIAKSGFFFLSVPGSELRYCTD